jgi:hypothetical protein
MAKGGRNTFNMSGEAFTESRSKTLEEIMFREMEMPFVLKPSEIGLG